MTTTDNDDGLDEISLVPVPRRHLAAVYTVLASAMGTGTPADASSDPPLGVTSRIFGDINAEFWSPDKVRLFQSRLKYPGATSVISMAAERAPKEVTLAEVEAATGTPIKQIRAELGAMSKLAKKLLGGNKWPISVRYSEGGVANYGMTEEIAKWWLDC